MHKILNFLQKNGLSLAAFFLVLPFFLLTLYAHPLGLHDWDWAVAYGDLINPDPSFLEMQSFFYFNTMGRYASTAFTSTLQYWFSPTNFKIFLNLFFISFLTGIYFFTRQLFENFLSHRVILTVYAGVLCIYFSQLLSPYEAFYNISCVGTYNLGGLTFLIFAGLLIKKLRNNKHKILTLSDAILLFAGILAVGSNEVTLLATNLLLFLVIAGNRYYHSKWNRFVIILFIIILIFSCAAAFAPGNFTRMGRSAGSKEIFESIFLMVSVSIFDWFRWLSVTPLLLFAALYLPIGLRISKDESAKKFFNYPLFSGFGVLILQPACLLLLFYSSGASTFPERYTDLFFLLTLLGMLYFFQSCLVVLVEKELLPVEFKMPLFIKILISSTAVFSLFFSGLQVDKTSNKKYPIDLIKTSSNSTQAYLVLLSGQASVYDKGMKNVYSEIKECTDKDCYVTPPVVFPPLIYDKIYDRKALNGGGYIIDYFHGNRERTEKIFYEK